jgi:hypothetical protein
MTTARPRCIVPLLALLPTPALPAVPAVTYLGGRGSEGYPLGVALDAGAALGSCGGGGGGPGPTPKGISHEVQGLAPATTYHWKVAVTDGAARVESAVRSCTTR